MDGEAILDFRFSIRTQEDVRQAQTLNMLMESSPHPMGFNYLHGGAPSSARFRMRTAGNLDLLEYQFDAPIGSKTVFSGNRSRAHLARNQTAENQLAIWLGGETHKPVMNGNAGRTLHRTIKTDIGSDKGAT